MANNTSLFERFKSVGTYRLFIDASTLDSLPAQTLRLLPGQWKNGPVNRAVLVEDADQLHEIFGQRDKRLERAGCFAGLIAEQMLATSPILVLNLRSFNDSDVLSRVTFAANSSGEDGSPVDVPFKDVYDTSNFWKAEPLNLLNAVGTDPVQLLNFSTLTNKSATIFITPTTLTGYDYDIKSVQDRFPSMYVPGVNCNDLVSDYMVDVWFFSEKLTNYESLAGSTVYGKYFTKDGIRAQVDGMYGPEALSKLAASGYMGRVSGSLIPDLLDINGNKLSLETAVNAVSDTTGIMCKIDPDKVDEFYNSNDIEDARFQRAVDIFGSNYISVDEAAGPLFADDATHQYLGMARPSTDINPEKIDCTPTSTDVAITKEQLKDFVSSEFVNVMVPFVQPGEASKTSFVAPVLPISLGDIFIGADGSPVRCTSRAVVAEYHAVPVIGKEGGIPMYTDESGAKVAFPQDAKGNFIYPQGSTVTIGGDESTDVEGASTKTRKAKAAGETISYGGDLVEYDSNGLPLDKPLKYGGTPITITEADLSPLEKKNVYDAFAENKVLLEYQFTGALAYKAAGVEGEFELADGSMMKYASLASVWSLTKLVDQVKFFKGAYLHGVALRATQFVDGTSARQTEVLQALISGGVYRSLMDHNQCQWRYVVDPFKTYIAANQKYEFAKICNDSKRAIAFSALPTKYDLFRSTDPYFKDNAGDPIESKYCAAGGNTDKPYSKLFSFAGQTDGAPFITYVANVRYNDGIDDMTIPATGILSNVFMRKHTEAGKHVFDVVAGDEWPLSGVGVTDIDMIVSQGEGSDMDDLEPAGWNMLARSDQGIITMLTSRSAQVAYTSAFSYIENLELLIYVADNIEPYLKSAQYKRNTANVRLQVKTKADNFMDGIVAAGGAVSYTNVCDSSNNDDETIARGFIVLDTEIINAQGIRIGVHRTTLSLQGASAE